MSRTKKKNGKKNPPLSFWKNLLHCPTFNYSDSYGMTTGGHKISRTKKKNGKKHPPLSFWKNLLHCPTFNYSDSYGMTTRGYKIAWYKKRMSKNTDFCHSGRISCIAQPSTIQIPTEWQLGVIKFHELKKEWQKKATLVILEESLALPNLQLFRFVRNDKESHNIIYFLFAVISAPLNHQDSKPFTSIWV